MTTFTIDILWQDDTLVVVNKPAKWLVHPTKEDLYETKNVLKAVRDQIGAYVYPIHRLDKSTTGVLVFALNADTAGQLGKNWHNSLVQKNYLAIVRGWLTGEGEINHPYVLRDERGPAKPALSRYRGLAISEIPIAIEKYPQSRYSLVQLQPISGRRHQLRRHMKHLNHPIIGDTSYGRGRHNRHFSQYAGSDRLLLHAAQLQFPHPDTGQIVVITAPITQDFKAAMSYLGWSDFSSLDNKALTQISIP